MPRIALGLQYDGQMFCGWQVQKDQPSVQATLEKAISAFATMPISVQCAGRTDTGVHALEQVVHFDVSSQIDRSEQSWVRGVNSFLPPSIAVQWAKQVPIEFHARFDAFRRRYIYLIYNHPVRSPIWYGKAGWYHKPLNHEQMHQAAQCLVGEHDFSTFRAAQCQAKSPVKTMYDISVHRKGSLVYIDIAANAFLHHMVRNIVGALIYVGNGKHNEAWVAEILAAKSRESSAPTFSPSGLYLANIHYPEHYQVPPRDETLLLSDWL